MKYTFLYELQIKKKIQNFQVHSGNPITSCDMLHCASVAIVFELNVYGGEDIDDEMERVVEDFTVAVLGRYGNRWALPFFK